MKKFIAPVFFASLLGLIAYVWFAPQGGNRMPSVNITTLDGKTFNTQSLSGKPALVTFWATSCVSCIKEIPDLIRLHNTYAQQGVNIVAVAMDYDPVEHVQRLSQEKALPYTVAHDADNQIATAFGVGKTKLTPANFLIAPDGRILLKKIGEVDFANIESQIRSFL